MANDLLTTVLLATRQPVFWVPAMNQAMWSHPLTQRNLEVLSRIPFYTVLETAEGAQACGDTGPGRMLEPEDIMAQLSGEIGSSAAVSAASAISVSASTSDLAWCKGGVDGRPHTGIHRPGSLCQ